jgi:apolipoprotein N-acyltransferase
MSALARRIVLSWGWERRLIAFFAGAIGVLALQPFGFIPAFFVPMTFAVWLLDGCASKQPGFDGRAVFADLAQAADVGWWIGFGYFLAGMWWIGAALLVDANDFAWALPFAVVGLPAGLALFTASGFVVARLLWSPGAPRVLALAAGLGLSEWLRGHLFTGFPWNAFGMALGGTPLLAQSASLFGLYGLTTIAVALFAAPALLMNDSGKTTGRAALRLAPGAAILAWAALIGFGAFRLKEGAVRLEPGVRLRIMQPDIQQDDKFRPENGEKILATYLSLSDRATSPRTQGMADATHLIWPESAFPFILSRTPQALNLISQALPAGTVLITGAARMEDGPVPDPERFFNSIQVIGAGGAILDSYDKIHLVPFGEYVPFQSLLEKLGIQDVVRLPGGFTPGRRRKLLEAPGLPPILPLICYEAIFPIEDSYDAPPGVRPGLILNLTNDGWFGNTIGPYQHFAQARLRAIEEGLPLVRAANTGISAVVDPYGRTLTQLPLGVANVLDAGLPQRIHTPWFARHPLLSPLTIWLFAFGGSFLRRRRQ